MKEICTKNGNEKNIYEGKVIVEKSKYEGNMHKKTEMKNEKKYTKMQVPIKLAL